METRTSQRLTLRAWMLFAATILLVAVPMAARAGQYTIYAEDVPGSGVADWYSESYAEGQPSDDCSSGTCCARNDIDGSTEWLEASDFTPFVLPPNECVTHVVVSAKVRYDQGTDDGRVRLRVRSVVNPDFPEETSDLYTWDQTNTVCRWVDFEDAGGWNITDVPYCDWNEYTLNHFRVAVRRFSTSNPPNTCRVDAFRVVITTAPVSCDIDPPGELVFTEPVAPGDYQDDYFTIYNDSADYGILSGTISESCSAFSILAGAGAFSLEPGDSWDVTVRFQPPAEGNYECTINTGTAACGTYVCRGVGACEDACSLYPPGGLDFGPVEIGECQDEHFTISNDSGDCGILTGSVGESSPAYQIIEGGGPFTLQPGQVLDVTVRFQPPGLGAYECIVNTGTAMCGTYHCTGTGIAPTYCFIDADTLDFGEVEVGDHAQETFTITNFADCAVLVGNVTESSPDFAILEGGGPFSLAPFGTRTVVVDFQPTEAGVRNGTISLGTPYCSTVVCTGIGQGLGACCYEDGTCALVSEDDCLYDPYSIDWHPGTCDPWPCDLLCEVNPMDLDFDEVAVGDSDTLAFTIRHAGGGILTGDVSESCPAFQLVSGAGPFALDPGDSLMVKVAFGPDDPEGYYECPVLLGAATCDTLWCYGFGAEGTAAVELSGFTAGLDVVRLQNPYPQNGAIWFGTHQQGPAEISICDVTGRRVRTLHAGALGAGIHAYRWDGRDGGGRSLPSGMYHVLAVHGGKRQHRSLVLVK